MPTVSIVIVCMNHPDNLYPCLESIRHHTSVSHELLVVAYLFDKEALEKARMDFPEARFIESDEIRGFAENNNLALREARGEFVLCLNDDTRLFSPMIDILVRDFAKLPEDAAILSPRIDFPNGDIQTCGRPPQTVCRYLRERYHLDRKQERDDTIGRWPVTHSIYRTSDINGACFLIRRDIFEELGWFDERYFFTPEDIALSTLARKKGYGVYVDVDASLIHYHHKTARPIITATKPAGMRGYLIFFSRGGVLRYGLIALAVWPAEFLKWLWSSLRCLFSRSKGLRIQRTVYAHNLCSIFTRRTPKQIFIRYYKSAADAR